MIPTISIITPVYNCEKYIQPFLDSVLKQTFTNWELICVDDGSTDHSYEIIQKYVQSDSRFIGIKEKHHNAGYARNIGLKAARGKWVCFLDSDDVCLPKMLETLVTEGEKHGADVVMTEAEGFSDQVSNRIPMPWVIEWRYIPLEEKGWYQASDCPESFFQTFIISPWNKLFLREHLEKKGIKAQSQEAANDVVLVCTAMASAKKIVPIRKTLYLQRRGNPFSITGKLDTEARHLCGYTASIGLKDELQRLNLYEQLKVSFLKLAVHNCLFYLEKIHTNKEFFESDFHFLHHQGFACLGVESVNDVRLAYRYLDKDELKDFRMVCEGNLQDYYREKMIKNEEAAQQYEWMLNKVLGDMTFKTGAAALALPKAIRKWAHTRITEPKDWRYKKKNSGSQRIAIFAFEGFHYQVLASVIKISNPSKNRIDVFTHEKARKETAALLGKSVGSINWHTIEKPNLKAATDIFANAEALVDCFLNDEIQKDIDCVILPSPEYHPIWYLPLLEKEGRTYSVISIAHNLNSDFFANQRNILRDAIFVNTDSIGVIDDCLKETLLKENIEKQIYVFPPLFCENEKAIDVTAHDKLHLTVTGIVEGRRKDYKQVVKALELVEEYHPQIKLVLLGKANSLYAQGIINELKIMEKTGLELVSYKDYVSNEEFERQMQETDCVIAPVVRQTIFENTIEEYGKTKVTGAIGDLISYAKAGMIVEGIPYPKDLEGSVITYHDEFELAEAIKRTIVPQYLEELKTKALSNARKFSLENKQWKESIQRQI